MCVSVPQYVLEGARDPLNVPLFLSERVPRRIWHTCGTLLTTEHLSAEAGNAPIPCAPWWV